MSSKFPTGQFEFTDLEPSNNNSNSEINNTKNLNTQNKNDAFTSRYQIGEFIGRGGFGSVFKLRDLKTNGEGVAKIVKMNSFREFKSYKSEIKSLIRVSKKKCYKHIVCLKDYAYYKNYIILITNYIDGVPMREFLNTKELSYDDTLYIMYQLCVALKSVHKQLGMAHMDIKPENVIIHPKTLNVSIIDFGLSCYKRECTAGGTLSYMSPEMASAYHKFKNVDLETAKASDIFSLGVVFYELLFCNNPFRKVDTDFEYQFIITKITKGEFPTHCRIKQQDSQLPKLKVLNTLVSYMLSFSPESRPRISDIIEILGNKAAEIYNTRQKILKSMSLSDDETIEDPNWLQSVFGKKYTKYIHEDDKKYKNIINAIGNRL